MHNTREENLRFKIAFTETNIRWLLGCDPIDRELLASHRAEIQKANQELEQINEDTTTPTT